MGAGVNVRLHDPQRHSWTISSFFLRVPRRDSARPPQCGQLSGCFVVSGVRAIWGISAIRQSEQTLAQFRRCGNERCLTPYSVISTMGIIVMPACKNCDHSGRDHNWVSALCSHCHGRNPNCHWCFVKYQERRKRGQCRYPGCRCSKYVPLTGHPPPVNPYAGRLLSWNRQARERLDRRRGHGRSCR